MKVKMSKPEIIIFYQTADFKSGLILTFKNIISFQGY